MTHAAPSIGRNALAVSRPRRSEKIARAARRAYEYFVFGGSLAAFGLLSLGWSLAAAPLYVVLPRRLGQRIGQFVIMAASRFFVGTMQASGIITCDLAALDALRCDEALVIAPNHPSLLDAVLVISRLPRIVCITKPGIWNNLFLAGAASLAGFIPSGTKLRLVKGAARQLRAGHHLLVFPEGTRTARAPIGDFKPGFAFMALNAGAPVQTVFIESNSRFLGKGWPFFKKPEFPLVYRVRLGRRFCVGNDRQAFVRELEQYYRHELASPPA